MNHVLNPEKNQNPKTEVLGKIGIVKEFTNKAYKENKMTNPVVNIKGKNYRMVSDRVKQFRSSEEYKNHRMATEMLFFDGVHFILKTSIIDSKGNVISDGIASEKVGSTQINTSSFAENCQTSSIGRALAFLDENLMGDSLPSADELNGAINTQEILKAKVESIVSIITSLDNEEQLKNIWDKNSSTWRKELGDTYFKMIEEGKNKMKRIFQKYEDKTKEDDKIAA